MPNYQMTAFGKALKNCLAEKEITRKEFAAMANISLDNVHALIRGTQHPSQNLEKLILRVFKLDLQNFKSPQTETNQSGKIHPYSPELGVVVNLSEYQRRND